MSARLLRRRYRQDNYLYLLVEGEDAALIDPGDPEVALAVAAAQGVTPRWIIHTHGHADHSGGSEALRSRLGAPVLGHGADAGWSAPDEDLAGRGALRLGGLYLALVTVGAADGVSWGSTALLSRLLGLESGRVLRAG